MTTASPMQPTTTRARRRIARLIGFPAAAALALSGTLLGAPGANAEPGPDRTAIVEVLAETTGASPAVPGLSATSPVITMSWDGLSPSFTVWLNEQPAASTVVEGVLTVDVNGDGFDPTDLITDPPVIGVVGVTEDPADLTIDDGPAIPVTFDFEGLWLPAGAKVMLTVNLVGDEDAPPAFGYYFHGEQLDDLLIAADALKATPADWLGYIDQVDALITGSTCVMGEPFTLELPDATPFGLSITQTWNVETDQLDIVLASLPGFTFGMATEANPLELFFYADADLGFDARTERLTDAVFCDEDGGAIPPAIEDLTPGGTAEDPAGTVPIQDAPVLANTGSSTVTPALMSGSLLLVLGAGFVLMSRRTGGRENS